MKMSLFAFCSAENTIDFPSGEKHGDSGSSTVGRSIRWTTFLVTTSSITIPLDLPNRAM